MLTYGAENEKYLIGKVQQHPAEKTLKQTVRQNLKIAATSTN